MIEKRSFFAWLGAYAFSLIVSTLGVGFSVGTFTYTVMVPILGHDPIKGQSSSYLLYYMLLVAFGVLTGVLMRVRWNRFSTPWVWILPVIYLASTIIFWLAAGNNVGDAVTHSLGNSGRERFENTWPLFSTAAFSVGVVLCKRVPHGRS